MLCATREPASRGLDSPLCLQRPFFPLFCSFLARPRTEAASALRQPRPFLREALEGTQPGGPLRTLFSWVLDVSPSPSCLVLDLCPLPLPRGVFWEEGSGTIREGTGSWLLGVLASHSLTFLGLKVFPWKVGSCCGIPVRRREWQSQCCYLGAGD